MVKWFPLPRGKCWTCLFFCSLAEVVVFQWRYFPIPGLSVCLSAGQVVVVVVGYTLMSLISKWLIFKVCQCSLVDLWWIVKYPLVVVAGKVRSMAGSEEVQTVFIIHLLKADLCQSLAVTLVESSSLWSREMTRRIWLQRRRATLGNNILCHRGCCLAGCVCGKDLAICRWMVLSPCRRVVVYDKFISIMGDHVSDFESHYYRDAAMITNYKHLLMDGHSIQCTYSHWVDRGDRSRRRGTPTRDDDDRQKLRALRGVRNMQLNAGIWM